jgi:hypothetical protein
MKAAHQEHHVTQPECETSHLQKRFADPLGHTGQHRTHEHTDTKG